MGDGRSTSPNKGEELYKRGQKFLEKKKRVAANKKDEYDTEELQSSYALQPDAQCAVKKDDGEPFYTDVAARRIRLACIAAGPPSGQMQLSDVVQQCVLANQAVEQILSTSPLLSSAASPGYPLLGSSSPSPQRRYPSEGLATPQAGTPPAHRHRERSHSAAASTPRSLQHRAQHAHHTRQGTPQRMGNGSFGSAQQHSPQMVIHKASHADGADFLTCGMMSSLPHSEPPPSRAVVERLQRRIEAQEVQIQRQNRRLNELQEAMEYMGLVSGVDWQSHVDKTNTRRKDFFRETPKGEYAAVKRGGSAGDLAFAVHIWVRITSYLPSTHAVVSLRQVSRHTASAVYKAAATCYLSWFKTEKVRKIRVNSGSYTSFFIPGSTQVRVLLERAEARHGTDGGREKKKGVAAEAVGSAGRRKSPGGASGGAKQAVKQVAHRELIQAPARIEVRGHGSVSFVTNVGKFDVPDPKAAGGDCDSAGNRSGSSTPSSKPLQQELPQGKIEIRSVSPCIQAIFTHKRWYPLPGDVVVLIAAGALLPPLADVASEKAVTAWAVNEKGQNPWTLKIPIPKPASRSTGQFELRYLDSLARPLATSAPFTL